MPLPHRLVLVALSSLFACCLLTGARRGEAAIIFVDNVVGDDGYDGSTSRALSEINGPLRTIRKALRRARAGDTIVLANNEVPYYEPIQLSGARHSGFEHAKFTIVGNGSVIDGSRSVPPDAWRKAGKNLWKLSPWRKGHYQLLLDGRPVPEFPLPEGAAALPPIPVGHWLPFKGAIYYQAAPLEFPSGRAFQIAYHDVGLTLYQVHDVQILDLTFRHFRLDGVSAPDLCRYVVLENVTSVENGRAGIAVGGTADVVIRHCRVRDNRRYQLLIEQLGTATVEQSDLSEPPTVVK